MIQVFLLVKVNLVIMDCKFPSISTFTMSDDLVAAIIGWKSKGLPNEKNKPPV